MKTTQKQLTTEGTVPTRSSIVAKLERNEKDVHQLRSKLNSYACEPCTYMLFERIEVLKSGLDSLSSTNREIIASMKGHRKTLDEYVAKKAKLQFSKFKTLRDEVEDYMKMSANYSKSNMLNFS